MNSPSHRRSVAALAEATPASRDRYVDLLRAVSIAVVVLGHWLMAIVYLEDGRFTGASALDVIPGLWIATWVLQVMPLFFFVGGFANRVAWTSARRRGHPYGAFLRDRVRRLMRPTLVFVGVWLMAVLAIDMVGEVHGLARATEMLAKPLWFLAVYVGVVAAAPAMVGLHERWGWRVPALLAAAAGAVDAVRLGWDLQAVGYVNFAFVWLFAHQLGFFYADGSLGRRPAPVLVGMAAVGLAATACLTLFGPYSPSMVGMATDKASNNSPPSVCLIALTVWLVGAAMAVRPAVTAWLQRPRPWAAVVAANSMLMTVFLWHLTAVLLAVVVLYPLGFPQPRGGTLLWWLWRPVWLSALLAVLALLVRLFHRFERPPACSGSRRSGVATVLGLAALVAGLAGFATGGFAFSGTGADPAVNGLLVALGYQIAAAARPPA